MRIDSTQNAMTNYQRNPRYAPPSAVPGGKSLVKRHKVKAKEIGIKPKEDSSLEWVQGVLNNSKL